MGRAIRIPPKNPNDSSVFVPLVFTTLLQPHFFDFKDLDANLHLHKYSNDLRTEF